MKQVLQNHRDKCVSKIINIIGDTALKTNNRILMIHYNVQTAIDDKLSKGT